MTLLAGRYDRTQVSPSTAKRGPGRPTKHAGLSAKERKERRLLSNRLAARRAYYRRTEKLSTLQNDNKALQEAVQHKDAQIAHLKETIPIDLELLILAHHAFEANVRTEAWQIVRTHFGDTGASPPQCQPHECTLCAQTGLCALSAMLPWLTGRACPDLDLRPRCAPTGPARQ